MRRSVASGIGAGLLCLSFGAPMNVGAHASSDKLVCSRSSNGGVLVRGVCILPAASVGQPYEGFILTSNSAGGTFSIVSGTVPPGMTMPASYGAAGTIVAGTPTASGRFPFTVRGSDDQGQPLRQAYSIRVGGPLPLRDTTIPPCLRETPAALTQRISFSLVVHRGTHGRCCLERCRQASSSSPPTPRPTTAISSPAPRRALERFNSACR